ncbi:MAG: hypothetical protein NTV62_02400 [Candidatus Gribaldobacteria bacterium]|nr:hypothetical protein [Candidatus Gribaldobacteria bacterium]
MCNLIIKGGGLADIGAVRITDGEIDEEDTDGAFFLAVGGKYNLLLDILLDNTYKIKGVYVGKYKLENEKGVQEEFLCFTSGECTFWTLAVETQTLSGLVDMKPKVLGK